MVTSILRGGLGNYMFQIGAATTLAQKYGDQAMFDFNYTKTVHKNVNTYKNNLFRKINYSLQLNKSNIYHEPTHNYTKIPYSNNLVLSGYFQSEKYLDRELILELFEIDKKSKSYILNKYGTKFSNTTSIHIRRGDYVQKQDRHPLMPLDYYYSAVQQLPKTQKVFIFSDDIKWCIDNIKFTDIDTVFVSNEHDYIDLWLMSMCENNIIANSTFSWWGAWLNTNKNKKVFSPKHTEWFGDNKKLNTVDLIPKKWEQL